MFLFFLALKLRCIPELIIHRIYAFFVKSLSLQTLKSFGFALERVASFSTGC